MGAPDLLRAISITRISVDYGDGTHRVIKEAATRDVPYS
jgi:hypothetical protein